MNTQQQVTVGSQSNTIKKFNSYLFMKKIIDVTVSLILLVLLSPLFALIAFILYKKEIGPVLKKELCVGKNNHSFIVYSFSTTTPATKVIQGFPPYPVPTDWHNDGLPDKFHIQKPHCLVTKTGRKLKKYNLEKLPQLWNVFKGEMSLVGPKPEYIDIAYHYNHLQKSRLRVKPGITGYAQIHGLTNLQHNKMIRFDLFYINHCSARLDTKIVFCAIKRNMKR